MEILQTLGIALGLATLAGLNLYLTVFVTGLSIQQGWIILQPQYQELGILAHPAILIVSGVMYVMQFFADKVPWVDTLWDAFHTFIRPVGGALLAIRVLGRPDPVFDVIVALLAGGVTLIAHGAKAGTRLVVNHSPEPFSNVALSVTEDVAVLGGLALISYSPELAFFVFAGALVLAAWLGPKLWRAVKVNLWLLWRKVTAPSSDHSAHDLPKTLPPDLDILFHEANLMGQKVAWSVPCVSVAARGIPGNIFGHLVATEGDGKSIWFIGKRGWRRIAEEIDLTGYKAVHEPKFLSENVILYSLAKKPRYTFIFDRSCSLLAKVIATTLQERLAKSATPESVLLIDTTEK